VTLSEEPLIPCNSIEITNMFVLRVIPRDHAMMFQLQATPLGVQ
jgi:hypothetical protein